MSAALDVVIFGLVLFVAGCALLVIVGALTRNASGRERYGRPEVRTGLTLGALTLAALGGALVLGACAVAIVAEITAR